MKNSNFYDELSPNYDEMIDFDNSLKVKMENLKNFISPHFKTALDLGCGTGTDSISLSQLGFTVDAVDHSEGMLEKAKTNAVKYKSKINFIQSGLGELNLNKNKYDLIVSLGNTIANIDHTELQKLLKNLKEHLNLEGKIIIQLINYSKLPKSGNYILNEFENEAISLIRMYNIFESHIDFIIKKKDKAANEESEIITQLYPHSANDFIQFAAENEFCVKFFGSLMMEPYLENKSQSLVVKLNK